MWQLEQIELPRIIDSKDFHIEVPTFKVETFTDAEVAAVLDAASDSMRLYVLLMLNCGMTQIDVANLLHEETDLRRGRIRRKRTKTREMENVPEVEYLLWPTTARLLRAKATKKGERVLLNQRGEPLRQEWLGEQGKHKHKDNIADAFKDLRRKLRRREKDPIDLALSLKYFRKTASSRLGDHKVYKSFSQYFLGHAPDNVADRHYVRPSQDLFDEAIAWLGRQFGQYPDE